MSSDPRADAPRGVTRWVALGLVYLLGLASWTLWVGAMVYLVVRFFTPAE